MSSPFVLIPLSVVVFFLVRGTWNIYLKNQASIDELVGAQERLTKLQGRESSLALATARLSTDVGIEGEIRDRFQMARAGEKEVVIVDSSFAVQEKKPLSKGFLQKIFDFFTMR